MKRKIFVKNVSIFAAGALAVTAFQYFRRKKNKNPQDPQNQFFISFINKWKTKIFPPNSEFSRRLGLKSEYDIPTKDFHADIINRFGLPSSKEVLAFHDEMIVSTDTERKIPNWVIECYDRKNFRNKKSKRQKEMPKFSSSKIDYVDKKFRAKNSDYSDSGYSKGHLAPASCHMWTDKSLDECHWLNSNVVPQNRDNKANFWARIEIFIRHCLLNDFKKVTVMTGSVFVPQEQPQKPEQILASTSILMDPFSPKEPPKKLAYETIGKNNVAVPTHLFKVIVAEPHPKTSRKVGIGAFLIPNTAIPPEKTLEDFEISIGELEKLTGYTIFDRIERPKFITAKHGMDQDNEEKMKKMSLLEVLFQKSPILKNVTSMFEPLNLEISWDEQNTHIHNPLSGTAASNKKNPKIPASRLCEIARCDKFFTEEQYIDFVLFHSLKDAKSAEDAKRRWQSVANKNPFIQSQKAQKLYEETLKKFGAGTTKKPKE